MRYHIGIAVVKTEAEAEAEAVRHYTNLGYPDAVATAQVTTDPQDHERNIMDVLVWATEEDALNDDGAYAIARLTGYEVGE